MFEPAPRSASPIARFGGQPIAIAAAALVIVVLGVSTITLWRSYSGSAAPETDRVVASRQLQTRAAQASEQLVEKTKGLKAGDPKEQDTIIGPLITDDAVGTVKGRVDDAVAKGARVLAGGEADGAVYQATLLADVPADSDFARIETFGPVVAVEVVGSADEAVRRANDTTYGLAAGIITSDPDRGLALAQQIESGIVHVNDQPIADEPQMPFGGVKGSGFGRFGGTAAINEFTDLHWVTVRSGTHPFPF